MNRRGPIRTAQLRVYLELRAPKVGTVRRGEVLRRPGNRRRDVAPAGHGFRTSPIINIAGISLRSFDDVVAAVSLRQVLIDLRFPKLLLRREYRGWDTPGVRLRQRGCRSVP